VRGKVRHGGAGEAWHCGVRKVTPATGWFGKARPAQAGYGRAWDARFGQARSAGFRLALHVQAGGAGLGKVTTGTPCDGQA
jgi:hypothetical protein